MIIGGRKSLVDVHHVHVYAVSFWYVVDSMGEEGDSGFVSRGSRVRLEADMRGKDSGKSRVVCCSTRSK